MDRRQFLSTLVAGTATSLLASCGFSKQAAHDMPLGIPESEWRNRLSGPAYSVLFEEATERPNSSPLNNEKGEGVFLCAACNSPIFESYAKYDSGTGWPSFWNVLDDAVDTRVDRKLVLPRTEYHCAHCSGHQGHVFRDGTNPTGLRYCNNGLALIFVPNSESLPARLERRTA